MGRHGCPGLSCSLVGVYRGNPLRPVLDLGHQIRQGAGLTSVNPEFRIRAPEQFVESLRVRQGLLPPLPSRLGLES